MKIKKFITLRSLSLWMLPLILIFVYTFFHYGTLNLNKINLFSPFEGAYLVYTGWFVIGLVTDIILCLNVSKRRNV